MNQKLIKKLVDDSYNCRGSLRLRRMVDNPVKDIHSLQRSRKLVGLFERLLVGVKNGKSISSNSR